MAKARAYVLSGGSRQILSGSAGFGSYVPFSFQIGDTANFVPATTETQARGNIVYVGNALLMQSRIISDNEVRFTFVVPESAGPFNVGNIVMNTVNGSGIPTPFIMVVLPYVVPKKVSAYDTGTVGLAVPGNRLLVNVTLQQNIVSSDDPNVEITVQIITPQYANLSFLDTEANLPAPELMPWNQMILGQTDLTKGPGFVSKDAGNKYWIIPFLKDLRSPSYDVLGGGMAGDGHSEADFPVLWGHRFTTTNYTGKIGGASFLNAGKSPISVGGAPFRLPAPLV